MKTVMVDWALKTNYQSFEGMGSETGGRDATEGAPGVSPQW